jgi:hypothetical protein
VGSVDALRCIAWGGRALVVGFAGGAIEQVRALAPCRGVESIPDHPSWHLRFHDIISSHSTSSFSRTSLLSASSGVLTLVRRSLVTR